MELKQILKVLLKNKVLIILFTLLGLAASGGVYALAPKPIFEASALLFISRPCDTGSQNCYTYDGFYAQQAAFHYSDTVIPLAKQLGADRAVRKSEQLVEVTNVTNEVGVIKEKAEEELRQLIFRIISESEKLNQSGDPSFKLQLVNDQVTVENISPNLYIFLILGLVSGIGLGVLLVALKEYLAS